MDDTEALIFLGFAAYSIYAWVGFYFPLFSINPMLCQPRDRLLLLLTPAVIGVGLWFTLQNFADSYVRTHVGYIIFYWVWGIAWLGLAKWFLPFVGFSVRDDGLERRNTSATVAICGALIGLTAAYVGGNIGDGPGWWVVLYCISFSTISFFLAWLILEFFTQISETITIERNFAAGLRLAGLLIVFGIILGRAASGNWVDYNDFNISFAARAWYILPLLVLAIIIERYSKPTVEQPNPSGMAYSLVPILAYALMIVIAVLLPLPGLSL